MSGKNTKLYKARTIEGAERKVRELQKQLADRNFLIEELKADRLLLAKLAADEAMFYNPLTVAAAKVVRDRILAER